MSKGTRYTQQSYKVSDAFPFEWIKKKWKENFYITSMATAGVNPKSAIAPGIRLLLLNTPNLLFFPLKIDTRRYSNATSVCSCLDCACHLSKQQASGDNKTHLL